MSSALTWPEWLEHGDKYLKSGTPKEGGKVKLLPTIRYNLLSMSLESYVMAILDFHDNLPDNHTFTDLMDGLERVMPVDAGLRERILKYENIQSICSLEKFHIKDPTNEELVELREAIAEIGEIAHQVCDKKTAAKV